MGRIASNVAEHADRAVRTAALACDQAVVIGTPVDTGRARANWIPTLDAASSSEVEAPSSAGSAAQQAIDAAESVVAGYDGDAHASIHITNNLPYIARLDEGWSAQAPAGFVRTAVQAGVAAVKNVRVVDGN